MACRWAYALGVLLVLGARAEIRCQESGTEPAPSTSGPAESSAPPSTSPRASTASASPSPAASTAPPTGNPEPAAAASPIPAARQEATVASPLVVRWDYLPVVGYIGDTVSFSLRVGADAENWHAHSDLGALAVDYGADHATVNLHLLVSADGPGAQWISFDSPKDHRRVQLVAPGHGKQLQLDSWHLSSGGDAVVLVVDRTEPNRDRRWRPVRLYDANQPISCALTLATPVVMEGASGIIASIVSSQHLEVADKNVLVMVPASDQLAAWKHREYRQVLAWLVSDLLQRRAGHVVLVEPLAPKSLAADLKPIITEVHDVADAYHCHIVPMAALGNDQYWQIAPGILGTSLNAGGCAALDAALAPWH